MRPSFAWLIIALAVSHSGWAASAIKPLPANPRDLPSLTQKWTWKANTNAGGVVLHNGVTYVRGGGKVAAINADTGRVVWERVCGAGDDQSGEGPVVAGDAVAASFGKQVVLLDRQTGRIRQQVRMGPVHKVVGPPLLIVASGPNERADLVLIDAESGEVLARREVGGIVYDVKVSEGVAVAIVGHVSSEASRPENGEDDEILAGYTLDSLREIWRHPFDGFPDLHEINGGLYAATVQGEGDDSVEEFRKVNPATGELGPSLSQRLKSNVSGGLTWEIELVGMREGKEPARLRRNSLETGRPVWSVELPGNPTGWVRVGDALYLHCDHEGGRGVLIVLDWGTGVVKQAAYGLRDVRGLFSHRDSIVAWTHGGLTAFSATAFGPPEKPALREEVDAILAGVEARDFEMHSQIQAAVNDLNTLGRRALPFVTDRIPLVEAPALVAAARVVAEARFRAAAAPLAARLADPIPPATSEYDRWDPAAELLKALAKIGGPDQVAAIVALLNDSTREGSTRLEAFAALASIGTPAAIQAIEGVLAEKPKPEPWWQPASPENFVQYLGRPDLKELEEAARKRGDMEEMHRLDEAAGSARVPLADGGALFVFHDGRLGGHKDLWVAQADETGRLMGPSHFLGGSVEGGIRAHLDGGTLVIDRTSPPESLRFEVAEIGKDSDGDGLPDLVERRLGTDPTKRDTDGDGLIDSEDPAPNGATLPHTEEEEIVRAVFQQFYTFEGAAGPAELAVMVSESHLQWIGRRGPTITVPSAQHDQFVEEAGRDGIAHIFIAPGRQQMGREEDAPEPETQLAQDERQYKLTSYRGGLNAVGYDVIVRKLGRRWLIKQCQLVWVS